MAYCCSENAKKNNGITEANSISENGNLGGGGALSVSILYLYKKLFLYKIFFSKTHVSDSWPFL